MKKILPLALILLVAFGCNKEKIYKKDLNGEWSLYKYLLYNVDRTPLFQTQYPDYRISFTEGGNFTETYYSGIGTDTVKHEGTYAFQNNDEQIVLTHTATVMVDTVPVSKTVVRTFTIFNLMGDHVQLKTDTSQWYLEKK